MPWLYTDAVVYSRSVNFQLFSWGLEGGEKYPGVILGGKFLNDLSNGELLHFNLVRVTSRSPVCPVEAGGRDYKSLLGHSNPTAAGPTEPPLSFPSRPPHLSLFSRPLYKDRKSDPPHPPPLPSRPQPSLSLSLRELYFLNCASPNSLLRPPISAPWPSTASRTSFSTNRHTLLHFGRHSPRVVRSDLSHPAVIY